MQEAEIPIYEIDPKKKYILFISGNIDEATRERIREDIRLWIYDTNMPFLIVNGGMVKLVKVEEADESR